MEAIGSSFKLYVQEKMVDYWNDDRLPAGGLGFLEEPNQRAEVQSVRMSFSQATGMERDRGARFIFALLRWCGMVESSSAAGGASGV